MTPMIEFKKPRARFARSINVERDAGGHAIDGYLPVGRALDTLARLATALHDENVEVALSITGPYGSGKSSLAVVIDAILGPADDPARQSAEELLAHAAPDTLAALTSARAQLDADTHGFIRAITTAQREPIPATVLRGLVHGAERYQPPRGQKTAHNKVLGQLRAMRDAYASEQKARPETREIRDAVADLGKLAPVLLLIDEFGKNLEAFADSHSDADLFLLQELAEWTRGQERIPLALVTLQHMAFDEYATGTTDTQRREWAKIQGRFEDIPYRDSPTQTRALIAAAFEEPDPDFAGVLDEWAKKEARQLATAGLNDLAADPEILKRCWPLHPLSVAVLPELCERYAQNERTLFSFLAGHEPRSVATFLDDTNWNGKGAPPSVRLDHVYDYFLESATTTVGVSSAASRWVEIDNRICDAHGIDKPARRVLKTVGLLNLISSGGTLRASRKVVCHAATDGQTGTATKPQVEKRLGELEAAGLLTFRDFADEYRVWQGSDFDLKTAIDLARRRLRDEPAAQIVGRVLDFRPLVAARHSHKTGTLRAFATGCVDPDVDSVQPLGPEDRADGSALYVLGSEAPAETVERRQGTKPIAFQTTADPEPLIDAAREVAAIDEVLASTDELSDDWVARRELHERRVEARAVLDREFEAAYGTTSTDRPDWLYLKPTKRPRWTTASSISASTALSEIADVWYARAPVVRNDLVNRHDLSSQAAKARRLLIEAMLAHPHAEGLGIEGFGPDRTMYLSVLVDLGLHREGDNGWGFTAPPARSKARPVWDHLVDLLRDATRERVKISDLYDSLAAPPYGVRAGIAPILLVTALLVHSEEVALYEHGTFQPALTAEVAERLLKNPGNFEVKHFATRSGGRAALLTAIADRLAIDARRGPRNGRVGSVLAVLTDLVALVNRLPDHVKRTAHLSAKTRAIRDALLNATEPDDLLFRAIPEALDASPIRSTSHLQSKDADEIAAGLAAATEELETAFAALLDDVRSALGHELQCATGDLRERLAARAREIAGKVIDPKVKSLIVALRAEDLDDDAWAEYVGMTVTDTPPAAWTDDDRRRFFTLIHDIGQTFRRIEALHADIRSHGDGYDAVRVTLTRPDGHEAAKLVWIDDAHRTALTPLLERALDAAAGHVSSDVQARELLLALLAERDLPRGGAAEHDQDITPVPYSELDHTNAERE